MKTRFVYGMVFVVFVLAVTPSLLAHPGHEHGGVVAVPVWGYRPAWVWVLVFLLAAVAAGSVVRSRIRSWGDRGYA